jgi:hypothetical protein
LVAELEVGFVADAGVVDGHRRWEDAVARNGVSAGKRRGAQQCAGSGREKRRRAQRLPAGRCVGKHVSSCFMGRDNAGARSR